MLASSKWPPTFLIVLGAALIALAAAFPAILSAKPEPASTPVPGQVSGYTLVSEATGKAALSEFSQLHGKSLSVLSGSRATYGAGNQVTLWVAGTSSNEDTRQLLEDMRDKIAEGKSPFQPTENRQVGERTIYTLDGMGQKHFYFQSGKNLIWLAANVEIADRALQDALNYYR